MTSAMKRKRLRGFRKMHHGFRNGNRYFALRGERIPSSQNRFAFMGKAF
jgi:hypothetical protein